MVRYTPSFVNLSGASEAIGNALQQAAALRQRREMIAQEQLKDFEKNYDTKKIRARDIPDFLMAFERYKKIALEYSKLNNSNANSAKLAAAEEAKFRSMREMNDIYTNSATANDLLNQRNQYIKQLGQAKYSVPDEVADEIDILSTTPASQLDFKSFKNPYQIDLNPNVNDYNYAQKGFSGLQKGFTFDEVDSVDYEIGDKKVKVKKLLKTQGANPEEAINTARTIFQGNSKLKDEYNKQYENIKTGLSIPPNSGDPQLEYQRQASIQKLQNIQATAGNWVTPENLSPEIMLANSYNAFGRQVKGLEFDDNELKTELKLAGLEDKDFDNYMAQIKAAETKRHNLATEGLSAERFKETKKQNEFRQGMTKARFGETQKMNIFRMNKTSKGDRLQKVKEALGKKKTG
jgi:hypothetical protein